MTRATRRPNRLTRFLQRAATLDFVSWKGLQWMATGIYGILAIVLAISWVATKQPSPIILTSLMSLLVMIGRCLWTYDAGFWGNSKRSTRHYSEAVKKEHLALWSPAFMPERMTVVSAILLGYLSAFTWENAVATTVIGLLATGALLAAVVTSPHALFDLQKTLDEAQHAGDSERSATC